MNRQTFMMNTVLDEFVMRPIAKGYVNVVPEPVRTGVTNVFVNLGEPSNVVNNALQGKGEDTLASVFRFLINTTFGLGGILMWRERWAISPSAVRTSVRRCRSGVSPGDRTS